MKYENQLAFATSRIHTFVNIEHQYIYIYIVHGSESINKNNILY